MPNYIVYFCLVVLLSLGCISPSVAKKIFRYQDENGQWHYSDTAPNAYEGVTETLLIPSDKKQNALSIINHGSDQKPNYFIRNDFHMPIEVRLFATQSKNIVTTPPLPLQKVISPRTEQYLFQVQQKDLHSEANFQFSYEEVFGNPKSIHNDNAIYQLPFEKNNVFLVSQAFNGAASHFDLQNLYAIDFSMPIGTKVLASRSGVIAHVKQDFYDNGMQNKYRSKANSIRILHDDGSMAVYAHLKGDRVFVSTGDSVNAGDLIAESGNTGFSSGPHLHFVVQKNTGMRLESIPFQFTLPNGKRITPKQGEKLAPSP